MLRLEVKKLHPEAKEPVKSGEFAEGYDIFCLNSVVISPPSGGVFHKYTIKTGIAIAIPYGYCGLLVVPNELAVSKGLIINAGVISPDFRDEVAVTVTNTGIEAISLKPKTAIAKLILVKIALPNIYTLKENEKMTPPVSMDDTVGEREYGSTVERKMQVQDYLIKNPEVADIDLATKFGVSERTITRYKQDLKLISKKTKKSEIQSYLFSHPDANNTELAKRFGISERMLRVYKFNLKEALQNGEKGLSTLTKNITGGTTGLEEPQ